MVDDDGWMTGFGSLDEVTSYVEPGHVDEVSMVIGEDGSFIRLLDGDPITTVSCDGPDEVHLRRILSQDGPDSGAMPISEIIRLCISQNMLA